jgi:hypothetical protein
MSGRRPWKVDCTDDSTASDMAMVMLSLSLAVWMERNGQRGFLMLASLRRGQLQDRVLEAWLGDSGRS